MRSQSELKSDRLRIASFDYFTFSNQLLIFHLNITAVFSKLFSSDLVGFALR